MFINYKKLAKEIVNQISYDEKRNIADSIAHEISEVIKNDDVILDQIKYELNTTEYDYNTGTYRERRLQDFVSEKVATKLVHDVYELNKAEILKEVSGQGILNVLQEQLQESAKQHVLDYITKPMRKE